MSVQPTDESVTNFVHDAAYIGIITAGALLIEHLTLWRKPWRLSRAQSYSVGTATLGIGFSAWAFKQRAYQAIIAWWLITAIGGIVVILAHWLRAALNRLDKRAFHAGQAAAPLPIPKERINGHHKTTTPIY